VKTIADFAQEFTRRAQSGEKPTVRVQKDYAQDFLGELARGGITIAKECLEQIRDPELRRIVETIIFAAAGGAALGAAVGGMVGGAPGAKVGAVIGTSVGVIAGCIAIVITVRQEDGPNGPALVVSVA
jgi:uncharacterized protein YcfJ